ncbi:hypothetical protein COT03_01590 [Candidatus Shapirobacteria bacterium CG07_land_8_20_14_0_80_39_18]|uniref:O-antigen ligase-related domain-containing protein n=1 Tax=Candidatus Shapirobacteria bacterium CG07_land_8_20_14_0_80_39_18 TaxID=1974882 RepID=A0A2M6YRA8_9BACT|nr:MAG: hypothetical protein COT03_01590 [Candidatus Shapirobacteria bacterium CG07_land_8_20_14_0_80_39_18]
MNEILLSLLVLSLPLQFGRHFWLKNSYIFGLKVDYLSPTLYFQDILIVFLVVQYFRKNPPRFNRKVFLFSIFYFLFSIFNILFSLTPLLSLFAWLRISEFILLGLVVSKNSHKVLEILGKTLPVGLIFEFGLGFVQTLTQSSVGGFFWFLGERTFNVLSPGIARGVWLGNVFLRPYGTFSHPNSLAGFILVAIILTLSKKKLNLLDKLSVSLGFALIILCFSRTVWLVVLTLEIYFVLSKIFLGFKAGFRSKKLSLNFPYLFSLSSILVTIFLFLRTTMEASSFENRRRLAEYAFTIIKQNPLFGIGANSFIISLAQKNTAWQWFYWLQPVHNIFLLAASETGLIGLVAFSMFLALSLGNLVKKRSPSSFYLLTSIFGILFTGLFDHYWLTLIQNQLLFVVVLGLSWGQENVKIVR